MALSTNAASAVPTQFGQTKEINLGHSPVRGSGKSHFQVMEGENRGSMSIVRTSQDLSHS